MTELKSPYKLGAEQGLKTGLLISAAFFCSVYQEAMPLLSFLLFALLIIIPLTVYAGMRLTYVDSEGRATFAALWMQGIMTFICGSLLGSLVALLYLNYLDPTYIHDTVDQLRAAYTKLHSPEARQMADVLGYMIDNHLVPTNGTIVMGMFWLMVASGSVSSIFLSLLARARKAGPRHSAALN